MSVHRQLIQEIEEVPFPREYLEDLKQFGPLIIEGMKRDGFPIESGNISLGMLDGSLDRVFFLFTWISDNNEVIQNLNMVLNDMRSLPTDYILFRGSPKIRFYPICLFELIFMNSIGFEKFTVIFLKLLPIVDTSRKMRFH